MLSLYFVTQLIDYSVNTASQMRAAQSEEGGDTHAEGAFRIAAPRLASVLPAHEVVWSEVFSTRTTLVS